MVFGPDGNDSLERRRELPSGGFESLSGGARNVTIGDFTAGNFVL